MLSSGNTYEKFIDEKIVKPRVNGFDIIGSLPKRMKRFQKDIVRWACLRGRCAIFAATGLGKTIQELAFAQQIVRRTDGRVLLFAPLAVVAQTVAEARKFGIPDVASDRDDPDASIVVTNYERLDKFDVSEFAAVILDESGILKSLDGKFRQALTDACRDVPYLLCASATPAPNDWTELGQHAEFLGAGTAKDMLSTYFVHEGSIRAGEKESETNGDGWRLKGHAVDEFWRFVASWAVMIRHPRDLGYDEDSYDLPPLVYKEIFVDAPARKPPPGQFFAPPIAGIHERTAVRRLTMDRRIRAVADVVAGKQDEPWLIWCNLNKEADALQKAIPGAVNVQGSDSNEDKIKNLIGFSNGNPRVLISKTSIAGRGMNWQHCANMCYFPNDSFEAFFQAVRRCWRFGQEREVTVHVVMSREENPIRANLRAKEIQYEKMMDVMIGHAKGIMTDNVRNAGRECAAYLPKEIMELPEWLR